MNFEYNQLSPESGMFSLKGNLIGEQDGIPITESFAEKLEGGTQYFIINLEGLQHINSSGLGVLITLLTKARKIGGEVVLAKPSNYINNLLVITKLNSIFRIGDELDADSYFSKED
ncbi:MAG: STAS domain-containing protein [Bacteroidota bacterium]